MKKTCFALFALCAAMASATVPNPLAFWKMDKVEGGKILDESGNGYDMTLGADCYLTNGLLGGKALYLTGSEGSYGTFSCPALKSRTLSFWMCREMTDGPLGASTNSIPYLFSNWSGFNVHWGFGDSGFLPMMFGRTANAYFGATNVTRRVWNHYAITLEDTGETNGDGDPVCHYVMYLDGAEYIRQENVQLTGPFYSSAVVCYLGNIPSFTRGVNAITQPPVVGVAAETPQPGDFAVALTAAVSDPAGAATRISWKGVSGPGGVWFRPAGAAKTLAIFSAVGTYVLRCTVENGEKAASDDVTVTVDTAATTAGVTNGLLAYWPVDDAYTDKVSGGYTVTEGLSDVTMRREPGVSGYAFKTTGFKAYAKASCGIVNDAANGESGAGTLVTNEYYRTFSMWLYHDGADTNATKAAALVHVKYNFGIWYNCEDGGTDFTLYQVGRYGSPISQLRFAGPGTNFTNRWVHVVAQVGRKAGMTSEVWVDGGKLAEKSGALTTGRALGNTDTLCIGGFTYAETPDQAPASLNNGTGYYVDGEGNLLSRHFPGVIDEIRVYGRRLSPNEIAYLGAVPFHGNFAPAVGGGDFRVAAYRATTLAALAGDDGLPAGSALTYKWEVVSGDAARISIADPSAVATLVTARKPGDYVLRLAVSDGERTTYGEPVVFSAFTSGTTFFVN